MTEKELGQRISEISTRLDRVEKIVLGASSTKNTKDRNASKQTSRAGSIDFDKPLRPFMKQYVTKNMSGAKKFTLLLARLTKGDTKKEITLTEIEKQWSRMTSIVGTDFNRFFTSAAKDNDWVESKRKGFYNLRPNWKEIFN
ncbi:MAG: hypothetical protein HYW95_01900 [Candidatus Wildermuthbacteria bacterium]|nr:hypothetical protein [Candidatus Wildermuthbacteria bacterium]